MRTIHVKASTDYDIYIENGLINKIGEYTRKVSAASRVLLVSDTNVYPLYGEKVKKSLEGSSFTVNTFILPAGEASKTPENMIKIVEACAEAGLTRSDLLVALGGGVIGDITGLSASLYQRGTAFVQIPTTLLADVDSSVGGKTAVDLKAGKNLLGAFYQPLTVICDPETTNTLTDRDFYDGCAEVIKYAVLKGGRLLELVEKGIKENLEEVIEICVGIKRDVVEADEFDHGERKLLNLGHTIGHAIEKSSAFSITHGSAVGAGMCMVARAAVKKAECSEETLNRLVALCKRYDLPTDSSLSADILFSAACSDKKREKDQLTLILPKNFGECIMKKMPVAELKDYIVLGKA